MVKRKDSLEENIETYVDEMKSAEVNDNKPKDDIEWKREELIRLSENGQIDRTVVSVKKASSKIVEKLYSKYERQRMQKANEFLTDQLISKFASVLDGLDAIESPDVLSDELRKDDLFKNDVQKVVELISPYIPYLGILSGGVTTTKRIYEHTNKEKIPTETSTEL